MSLEYQTVKFTNDESGIGDKNRVTSEMSVQRWRISSESIEPGHMKGGEACCGASICLPLGLLAGRTPGHIVVTFARESQQSPQSAFCRNCGSPVSQEALFCRKCGKAIS